MSQKVWYSSAINNFEIAFYSTTFALITYRAFQIIIHELFGSLMTHFRPRPPPLRVFEISNMHCKNISG
jgi:hypothetical protein